MERSGRVRGDRDPPPVGPPRLWTVAEANARLPELEELLPRLRGWVGRLAQVQEERERLSDFWGPEADAVDQPDHELKSRLDAELKHLSQRLEEALGALRAEGIEVKELGTGLVDFYGIEGGELVYLCWQRGEPDVSFYHSLTGGYRSRRPVSGPGRATSPRTAGPF
jgi:hypothetical protein